MTSGWPHLDRKTTVFNFSCIESVLQFIPTLFVVKKDLVTRYFEKSLFIPALNAMKCNILVKKETITVTFILK